MRRHNYAKLRFRRPSSRRSSLRLQTEFKHLRSDNLPDNYTTSSDLRRHNFRRRFSPASTVAPRPRMQESTYPPTTPPPLLAPPFHLRRHPSSLSIFVTHNMEDVPIRELRSKENGNSHRRSNFDHLALTRNRCSADAVKRRHRYNNDAGDDHRNTLVFVIVVIQYFHIFAALSLTTPNSTPPSSSHLASAVVLGQKRCVITFAPSHPAYSWSLSTSDDDHRRISGDDSRHRRIRHRSRPKTFSGRERDIVIRGRRRRRRGGVEKTRRR